VCLGDRLTVRYAEHISRTFDWIIGRVISRNLKLGRGYGKILGGYKHAQSVNLY